MEKISAYEWGIGHESCKPALEARKALGPDKTQADWWKICDRGDWLLWQLRKINFSPSTTVAMLKAVNAVVKRSIEDHAIGCGVSVVEEWAQKWLSGEDRSAWAASRAAEAAAGAAEEAAARAAELKLQAEDIHREIPEWPGNAAE